MALYFAHGTLQHGFPRWERHRALLGEPVGRYRTVEAWTIVVPRDPACLNPACRHLHRMCGLVTARQAHHAQGDLFRVEDTEALNRLEWYGRPCALETLMVVPVDGGDAVEARAYRAAPPLQWVQLAWTPLAETVEVYPRALAEYTQRKPCCVADPGHEPPHDVIDPFNPDKLADHRLRSMARSFAQGGSTLHMMEAEANVSPLTNLLHHPIGMAFIDWRHEGSDDEARLRRRVGEILDQYTRDCSESSSA
jgi:hypothetical protein